MPFLPIRPTASRSLASSSASASARLRRRRASPSVSCTARRTSPRSPARSTSRGCTSNSCSCTRPRSTTCFSPRPAGHWKVPRKSRSRSGREMTNAFATQVGHLAVRTDVRTARQPANVIASLAFPLAMLAVNSGGLDAGTKLVGFPTDSFVAFALAVPFIQGALFSTINAGADLARDIQTGFLNRLSLTPMRGSALLTGQLLGVMAVGVFQAVVYLAVGLAVGVELESGVAGALVLLLLSGLIALGFGAIGTFIALRTGSGEAVQGFFPALFVFLFISSMNMPRDLIPIDWFRIAASANPVSYLIEGVRSLIITGWDGQALALGFGVALAVSVVALAASSWALVERLART